MSETKLENISKDGQIMYSLNEQKYLSSVKGSSQLKNYSCISGCSSCVSCGGND